MNHKVQAVFGNDSLFFNIQRFDFTSIILFCDCYETKLSFSLKLNVSKTPHQYSISFSITLGKRKSVSMLSVDVIRQSKLLTVAAKSAKKKTSMLRRIKSVKLRKFCMILKLIKHAPQKTLSITCSSNGVVFAH